MRSKDAAKAIVDYLIRLEEKAYFGLWRDGETVWVSDDLYLTRSDDCMAVYVWWCEHEWEVRCKVLPAWCIEHDYFPTLRAKYVRQRAKDIEAMLEHQPWVYL